VISLLWVQGQNALNDNLVKFVLIGLALEVAAGSWIGQNISVVASSIIPLPFVLLAPVAGYLSDRFSKKRVLVFCVLTQVLILFAMFVALKSEKLVLVILGFVALSIQSAFFSPAKLGIVKELVGSKKLGLLAGLMQMVTMAAILLGLWMGGRWFKLENQKADSAWDAAGGIFWVVALCSTVPLLLSLLISRTKPQSKESFELNTLWSHFSDLREVWKSPRLRITMLGNAYAWFLSYLVGLYLINLGIELFPGQGDEAAASASKMYLILGIGLMSGSFLLALLSTQKIRLQLVPWGLLGVGLMMLLLGFISVQSPWHKIALWGVGFSAGFILAPLIAYLQDEAQPDERGKVLAANNLLVSSGGLLAGAIIIAMQSMKLSIHWQIWLFVPLTLWAAWRFWRKPPSEYVL